ncbi:MAG: ATP-dependent zinc metalloprotease FtsH, partial [Ktedonobacterales bacterium]
GRLAILGVHAKGKPLDESVSLEMLARQTPGFSGADLQNLLNEGAILTARAGTHAITMTELEEAVDRVSAGPERKSRIISEREKAVTAYHEIGHALVARSLPNTDPVHKVSIVARGPMGGYTRLLPVEERYLWSKSQFEDFLAFALGGHLAERIIFGEVTTGASNDIERVTAMARKMVTEFGMSDRIGPVALGKKEEMVFLGREIGEERNYSELTAREIDEEVRTIVRRAYETAERVLTEHKERLILMSEKLIQQETLEGPEFEKLFTTPLPAEGVYTAVLARTAVVDAQSAAIAANGHHTSEPETAS